MTNILLLDADFLAYLGKKEDTFPQIIDKVDNKIIELCEFASCEYVVIALSKGPYFRSEIYPDYKKNRKYEGSPYANTIKAYLRATYNCTEVKGLEADDICVSIINNQVELLNFTKKNACKHWDHFFESPIPFEEETELNFILCSKDKDVYNATTTRNLIPDVWDPETRTASHQWITPTEEDVKYWELFQLLTGELSPLLP